MCVFGSRQPPQQSTTATQPRPFALQPPLDARGDDAGKPLLFGARRAPLLRPAQQLTPSRLTSSGIGRGRQDTPTQNMTLTAERSICLGKPFVFSPGLPSLQQTKVATQAQTPAPSPSSRTTGENAGKPLGIWTRQPFPQGPPQQPAPSRPPQARPEGRGQGRPPPIGPLLGARGARPNSRDCHDCHK